MTVSEANPEVWILKYGSGDIEALVASDRVSISNYTAEMPLDSACYSLARAKE